jgi:hypothetical protein
MYHPFAFNKQDIRPISLITSSFIDVLVIGGGGAGGHTVGGGGGAGGYISSVGVSGGGQSAVSVFTASMNTPYNLYVGAGGAVYTTTAPGPTTGKGSPTGFATNIVNYYANGGGRGAFGLTAGTDTSTYRNGLAGGSGGGGASWRGTGELASGSGGLASSGLDPEQTIYGYNGGSGSLSNASTTIYRRGGGGGGAGAVGSHADNTSTGTNVAGGNGGNGVESNITGELIYRAGGGGGGSSRVANTPPGGTGGLGGGGNGATGNTTGGNGSEYSGSGGGGSSSTIQGGSGGSGAIIIRYNRNDITHSVSQGVTIISETIPGNGSFRVLVLAGGTQQSPENITFSAIR